MKNFNGKTILVTGASGLIGSNLIFHFIKMKNVKVIALSKSKKKLLNCFNALKHNSNFRMIEHDISKPINMIKKKVDYIFHAAGPQESKIIQQKPVDVLMPNINGTQNCLNILVKQKKKNSFIGRLILFSSVTIYKNNSMKDLRFSEKDIFISNNMELGNEIYSSSKMMSELIVNAYIKQFKIDAVIARISTVYGNTINKTDTAFFEFIKKALSGKNIQIRDNLPPRRDNIYLDDAINGLLKISLKGKIGKPYNLSSNKGLGNFLAIDEIAKVIVKERNKELNLNEKKIKLTFKKSFRGKRKPGVILDNSELKKLGWKLSTSFTKGIRKIIKLNKYSSLS